MGRQEQPFASETGPLARFAGELRRLRGETGLTYRELARRAHYSATTLCSAASGKELPSLDATLAFATACGADPEYWRTRWHSVADEIKETQVASIAVQPDELSAVAPTPARLSHPRRRLWLVAGCSGLALTFILASLAWAATAWVHEPSQTPTGGGRPVTEPAPRSVTTSPSTTRLEPVVDLTTTGPSTVAAQPTDGQYLATFDITVNNSGPGSYPFTDVFLTLPSSMRLGNSDFGGCVGAPAPETDVCFGDVVPLGGSRTFHVSIEILVAPTTTVTALTGFQIRFAADDNRGSQCTDPTPDNNALAVTFTLPANPGPNAAGDDVTH